MDSIYSVQSILAAWVLVAWLFMAGAAAHAFATSNSHWMIRYTLMILLFVPLITAEAYELFLLFSVSATLSALGIVCQQRIRKPSSEAKNWKIRYSISGILYITACVSIGLLIIQNTPVLDARAWSSLALLAALTIVSTLFTHLINGTKFSIASKAAITIAFGIVVAIPAALFDCLLFSLHNDLGWPPDFSILQFGLPGAPLLSPNSEWLWFPAFIFITLGLLLWLVTLRIPWRSMRIGITAILLLVIGPPIVVTLQLSSVPEFPQSPEEENAFQDLARLSEEIADSNFETASTRFDGWIAIPPRRLRAVVKEIEPKLEQLQEQLERPIFVPLDTDRNQLPTGNIGNIRTATKALLAQGRIRLDSGDWNSAADTYLSAVQLGMRIGNDGLLINALVSQACTSNALWEIHHQRTRFDVDSRQKLIAGLLKSAKQRNTAKRTFLLERIWMMRQGWHNHLSVLLGEYAGEATTGLTIERFEGILLHELTVFELLACELAIHGHLEQHGNLPSTLDDLVPNFLAHVPVDGFSAVGDSFQYLREGDSFSLYSVGADGDDDGGSSTEFPGFEPDAEGDLSLRGVFEASR